MNVVSFSVKLTASSAPAPTMCRARGSFNPLATTSSSANDTRPVNESSRPVRVTVRMVGLIVNNSAANGAPKRPSSRRDIAIMIVAPMPASAATSRVHPGVVPK